MKASIHEYFQVGTIQWMSHPDTPVLESIHQLAADPYFDALEIKHFAHEKERAAARDMLAQAHMHVCYGAQPSLLGPKLNPNDLNEDQRVEAEKVLLDAVDEAAYLGAKGIAFLAGKWTKEEKEQAYAQLLKTTQHV
ncbi:MAG: sugar phosphate isomerase/epimerase, partial [Clostridia bacterium]